MDNFMKKLQEHIDKLKKLVDEMENGKNVMNAIKAYLPSMNEVIEEIMELSTVSGLKLELNHVFVIQVLNDIVYGIENEDVVFLQDVLRYGLLEIYSYVNEELQER